MKKITTDYIVKVAILSALATVLMLIKFPIPIAPSFYKLEFSDIAALFGGFALGPGAAIVICLIKNIMNIILEGTTTMFIGELSNFLMSASLCATASFIYKDNHTKKGAVKSLIIGSIVMIVVAAFLNYFALIPAYVKLAKFPLEAIVALGTKIFPIVHDKLTLILFCTVPFNIVKALGVSLITFIVYKRISPLLHSK